MKNLQNINHNAGSLASFFGMSDARASELSKKIAMIMITHSGKPITDAIEEVDKFCDNPNELASAIFMMGVRSAEPEQVTDSKHAKLFKVANPTSKSLLEFLGISEIRAKEMTGQFLSIIGIKPAMEPHELLMTLDIICRRQEEMLFCMFVAMRTAAGMVHFKTEPLKPQGDVKYKDT